MKRLWTLLIPFLVIGALFSSCKSTKDYVYTKDLLPGSVTPVPAQPEITVKPGDRLSIFVSNDIQELALPFNTRAGFKTTDLSGTVNASASSGNMNRGYLVDREGCIEFPIFGNLKVAGLTLREVSTMIKTKITTGNYMKNPIVTTELLNFQVYVIGLSQTHLVTTYDAEYGQMTIFQLISKLGDVSQSSLINNVKVVREIDGERHTYVINLQSKEAYHSPAYYLQQNDEIYFEPRYRMREEINIAFRYMSIITALSSFATTMIFLFKK